MNISDFPQNPEYFPDSSSLEHLPDTTRGGSKFEDFVVHLTQGIWRLNTAVTQTNQNGTCIPLEVTELLQRVHEELKAFGIETIDPVDKAYTSGMRVEIGQFVPGGSGDYVISQTISPGVSLDGKILKPATVIVKREDIDGTEKD